MKSIKAKTLTFRLFLASIGMGYFVFFSQLDFPIFLKGYFPLIPIQILVMGYFIWRYFRDKSYSNND